LKNGVFALALLGFEASYGEAAVTFVVVTFASEVAIADISKAYEGRLGSVRVTWDTRFG